MLVEIRKAGFVNKGAELMLHAALERVRSEIPDTRIVMAPRGRRSYEKRAVLGLHQKAWLWRHGIQWGDLAIIVPQPLRQMYGVVLDSEIDVVLDAAGFSYSDQWGEGSVAELARATKRWKRNGTQVVLLPQAFGPFKTSKIRHNLKKAVGNIDLLFARDDQSYQHLTDVVGEQPKIRLAPDFTNLLSGVPPTNDWMKDHVCVVPNSRMIDKTDSSTASRYAPFLARCIRFLGEKGRRAFLLVHEGEQDSVLAETVSAISGGVEIIRESDPLRIKGILGASFASIGSRFHGLVSALSQGVPSIGTGWSHKYEALFADYGVGELLIDVSASDDDLRQVLDQITDNRQRHEIVGRLRSANELLMARSEEMWSSVFDAIQASQSAKPMAGSTSA